MNTLARSALVVTSLVLGAPLAFAQSDSDRATARELGTEGQAALDKRDYKTAEDLFRRAESLFNAPTLRLGYARAEAGLGKVVNATEAYNRIIREGVPAGAPQVFIDALAAAKAEVGAVQARIATVTVTIAGPTDPKVTLDDAPVPSAALGVKRPVDPGAHVVKATADGWNPGETSFTVSDAGTARASITMTPAAPSAVALSPSATTPSTATTPPSSAGTGADVGESGSRGDTQRTVGLVGMGVGGAGILLGAITGGVAASKHSSLSSACGGSTCPPDQSGAISSYHSMATVSTVGFIAGGVLAAGGAILFFTAPHAASGPSTGATVQPFIGLGTVGAFGRF